MPTDRDLFQSAIDIPDVDGRSQYLGANAPDPVQRGRVERLLAAHAAAGEFLEQPPADENPTRTGSFEGATGTFAGADPAATVTFPGREEHIGVILGGKYKLIEAIGEGGMGSVYMAQQSVPVKRTVAVKVIKAGMDSRAVLARFEAERQALAMMDHPNIAKVLDAGTTESGRPFFVMELVKGVPITQYCDERKLTPRQRLELFVPVCNAIQHAHQKGIIHRDIKPSNVLVALYDDRPVPKVIDFGVAKATGAALTDFSLVTGHGAVVGTPEYMSPEQASFNNLDIDTRSDVYSLGVLLYELLTGSTPVDRKSLGEAAMFEILRIVREVEAPKPSQKLSSSGTLPSVAANRSTEPAKLSKLMRGELDWVVLKALEKDRTRRYDTANGLARDIQRYLADEIVEARPASTGYRLKKFVRRHKGQVIAASVVLGVLLAGIAGTGWQAVRAENARVAEAKQREMAEENERKADEAKVEAQARAAEANAMLKFFREHVFAAAGPEGQDGGLGVDVTLRNAIVACLPALNRGFAAQPLVEAQLRMAMGNTFYNLAEYDQSRDQFERARALCTQFQGSEHPNTLSSMNGLALCYEALNRHADALKLFEEVLVTRKRVLPLDHADTLSSMHNLANIYAALNRHAEALALRVETLAIRKRVLTKDHQDTLKSMNNLAMSYANQNRHAEAVALQEETLAIQKRVLPKDHFDTVTSLNNLATIYSVLNRHADALKLFEEVLLIQKRVLPKDHPKTLTSISNVANSYGALNRHVDAVKLFEEVLVTRKRVLPQDHADTLSSMRNLAICYAALNRPVEALKLREETLAIRRRVLPKDDPNTLVSVTDLAKSYATMNRPVEALKLREETLLIQRRVLPKDHLDTVASMNDLANSYAAMNRLADAVKLCEEVLAIRGRVLPKDDPNTLGSMNNLAICYAAMNRTADALKLREETLTIRRRVLPKDDPDTLASMNSLAASYAALNRHVDALKLCEETLAIQKRVLPQNHPNTLLTMSNIAISYAALNRHTDALKLREETLAIRKSVLLKDHPDTLMSMLALADSLIRLDRGVEGIPLLDESITKSRTSPSVRPRFFKDAFGLRIQYFQKSGDPAGCRTTAEMWEKLNRTDAGGLYDGACFRAVAAAIQAKTPGADAARLAEDDADRAMQWLQKAILAGYKDAAHMKKDTDLDPLRDREDFKKLLTELEKGAEKK